MSTMADFWSNEGGVCTQVRDTVQKSANFKDKNLRADQNKMGE